MLTFLGEERSSGRIGCSYLPEGSSPLIVAAEAFAAKNPLMEAITDIAVIGIGGFSLGVKAVDALLRVEKEGGRKLHDDDAILRNSYIAGGRHAAGEYL